MNAQLWALLDIRWLSPIIMAIASSFTSSSHCFMNLDMAIVPIDEET